MSDEVFTAQDIVDALNQLVEETHISFELRFMSEADKNARIGAFSAVAVELGIGDLYADYPAKRAERI